MVRGLTRIKREYLPLLFSLEEAWTSASLLTEHLRTFSSRTDSTCRELSSHATNCLPR